jgi:DNA-directed RNA polymerase delta subunit
MNATKTKTKAKKAKVKPNPCAMSCIDAAAKVLAEKGEPMTCQEMIDEMAAKGYWKSPNGKTPGATLYASILREIEKKGKDARFKRSDPGKFASAGS